MNSRITSRIVSFTVRGFVEKYTTKNTVFPESIQRDEVWTKFNKDGYKQAILKNMTPMPIVMADIESAMVLAKETKNQQDYNVLKNWYDQGYRNVSNDGGNRTRYLNEEYDKKNGNFRDLTEIEQRFFDHEIQVNIYSYLTVQEMHEIAANANMGVPWNAADKRNVMIGFIPNYVRSILNTHKEIFGLYLAPREIKRRKGDEFVGYFLAYHQNKIDTFNQKSLDSLYKKTELQNQDQFSDTMNLWSKMISYFNSKNYKITKPFSTNLFIFLLETKRTYSLNLNMEKISEFGDKYMELEDLRISNSYDPIIKKSEWLDRARYAKDYGIKFKEILNDIKPFLGEFFITKDKNRNFTQDQKLELLQSSGGVIIKSDGTSEKISYYQAINGDLIHADHVYPHSKGGKTDVKNGQLLSKKDNLEKSDKI